MDSGGLMSPVPSSTTMSAMLILNTGGRLNTLTPPYASQQRPGLWLSP